MESTGTPLKVFISYRRADLGGHAAAVVGRIYDRLAGHYGGENVFMDVDTIPPGVRFDEYIDAAVGKAEVLLAVVGNQWTEQMQARGGDENDYVRLEIESALERSMPVVPLLIGGARMPQASDLPSSLGNFALHNAYPVDTERDFNPHVTRLIADLDKHFGSQKEAGEEVPAETATAPVIAVSEVKSEEEELDDEFQLVAESEVDEGFQPEHTPQVLGKDVDLPVSEEVTGLSPEMKARKRTGPAAWLVALGVLAISGILLGVWQPWKPGSDSVSSEEPKPGAAAQEKADDKEQKGETLSPTVPKHYTNSIGMKMAWCPPGTFLMGSPKSEGGRDDDEDQHEVTLTKGFWMATTEVTQEQWKELMGSNPSIYDDSGDLAPVENVSWEDALEFCQKLTEAERQTGQLPPGEEYSLPTEAQWEYACRAGPGASSFTSWYGQPSLPDTKPVAQKAPNSWGLYDMHGNVAEWCLDSYAAYPEGPVNDPMGPAEEGVNRVVRGGSCMSLLLEVRSANRTWVDPNVTNGHIGFRPVRTLVRSVEAKTDSQSVVPEAKSGRGGVPTTITSSEKNYTNSLGVEMVWCPPGTFLMGSPNSEEHRQEDEEQHEVTLTKGFWIAATEVTERQFEKMWGGFTTMHNYDDPPVPKTTNWGLAMFFCQKLTEAERIAGNLQPGEEYTLPTEAQWEYACRAGTIGPFNLDGAKLGELGWFDENSGGKTHPVGKKKPNAWGISDMHGNVSEWCRDPKRNYTGEPVSDPIGPGAERRLRRNSRVIRGGGCRDGAKECRSARRSTGIDDAVGGTSGIGFRLIRVQK